MSQALLQKIKEYVEQHKTLLFLEFMFNTLAQHNNLKIDNPAEMSQIIYRRSTPLIDINPGWLYHPIKSFHEQAALRKTLNR